MRQEGYTCSPPYLSQRRQGRPAPQTTGYPWEHLGKVSSGGQNDQAEQGAVGQAVSLAGTRDQNPPFTHSHPRHPHSGAPPP